MRIRAPIEISAPPEAVWEWVSDPTRALDFFSGLTRWEVVSDQPTGLGARYRMLMRVGSAEIGGLVEVVEHDEPRELAWTSVTGIDQRGRWRLRERDPYPCTDVHAMSRGGSYSTTSTSPPTSAERTRMRLR